MNISIVSVFKELYEPFLDTSLIKRARQKGSVSFNVSNFFDFVSPKERIDAPTFGPGAGMLIKPKVVEKAIHTLEAAHGSAFKIFFSPQGKKLTQPLLQDITRKARKKKHVMLLPARYEGMDARVEEVYADEIISVGDFVLMGGDIPAMMLLEGMMRLIPGVVGKQESVQQDSFSGPFVDYPEYTEPVEWQGLKVPEIVRSGNHAAIEKWRLNKAAEKTVKQHFTWLRSYPLSSAQKKLASQFVPPHYVALMHDEVLLGNQDVGTSSVMSIDIHDIARSSSTYGIKQLFLVTPLKDQQKIVRHFLSFWKEGFGVEYNKNRHQALDLAQVKHDLASVIASIEQKEGKKPILIATSARPVEGENMITYFDQERIWQEGRPVLLLFGTAHGLSSELIDRCDYILNPIYGLTDFNHLSVRSAAAIVLDRWLGINERYPKKLPE